MKRSWKSLAKQFNRLKLSERRLIAITSVVLVLGLFSIFIWEPLMTKWGKRSSELRSLVEQIDAIDRSIEELIVAAHNDPNDKLR